METPMLKMLSETDCVTGILKSQSALENASDDKTEAMAQARIAIWERLLFHVRDGRTVTLSMDERMQLWDISVPS